MHSLFFLKQTYSSPLPAAALLRRLEDAVPPRPTGLFWWLGIRRLPCWGKVEPANGTFWARMPWGRSDGPLIRGYWQIAADTTPSSLGTVVQLTIRLTLAQLLGGCLMLVFLLITSLLTRSLFATGLLGLFGFIFVTDSWWSIRRAERHFQGALTLNKLVARPA
jgi:hypothetical protein